MVNKLLKTIPLVPPERHFQLIFLQINEYETNVPSLAAFVTPF